MRKGSDAGTGRKRPSSYVRDSAATDLYVRFAAAETVVHRRLMQLVAVETALREAGVEPPARTAVEPPLVPELPGQFAADAERRRARSVEIVAKAVALLKAGKCKSRSPSKAEIVEMSRHEDVDPEGVGVSKNVFRTNQACIDILLQACLPFDAERRKRIATPSWAVRIDRDALIDLMLRTEADRDQLTGDLMAANELLIARNVVAIRRKVVQAKAQRMLAIAD